MSQDTNELIIKKVNRKRTSYFKDYWNNNNTPILCPCGKTIKKLALCKHIKTAVHRRYVDIGLVYVLKNT